MAVRRCVSAVATRAAALRPLALRRVPFCRLTRRLRSQVLLQTSQGDVVIDLHAELAPLACKNFLKLCKCAPALRFALV